MKNIVLLSDGTGNSSAKIVKTNVWRLYEALDLAGGSHPIEDATPAPCCRRSRRPGSTTSPSFHCS